MWSMGMMQLEGELCGDREWGPKTIKRTQRGTQEEQATPGGQDEDAGPARGAGTGQRHRNGNRPGTKVGGRREERGREERGPRAQLAQRGEAKPGGGEGEEPGEDKTTKIIG